MRLQDLPAVFRVLRKHKKESGPASVTEISETDQRNPYRVLIACLISLRTKDEVTAEASARLFRRAASPAEMVRLRETTIARAIYPAGFYKTKAKTIREVSKTILNHFQGSVPADLDTLLTLKGVGRKTANLVRTLGHGKPGICVDTHVHRICNRWGFVETRTPDDTERVLREILPKRYWMEINDLLVTYGREVCKPISPHCSACRLDGVCGRVGVERSR